MYVDSHCHLTSEGLFERVDDVQDRMREAGVDRALVICTTLEGFDDVHGLAQRFPNLWATVGVHPDEERVCEPSVDDLVQRAGRARVIAIGETGLDYFRLGDRSVADMGWQRERFRVHIRAARATGLPLVIHTRSASADTLAILAEEGGEGVGGVFHCFTETAEVARAALDLGFHISFSGILTFKNAAELREVASWVPDDRLLIETDSPYLAPVPHRGTTNEPSYVPWVARQLATLRQTTAEAIGQLTSTNFERLFLPRRS